MQTRPFAVSEFIRIAKDKGEPSNEDAGFDLGRAARANAGARQCQELRKFNCEQAALTEYKKQFDAREAKRLSSVHEFTKPITVQEVLADRRLVEAYCLKEAACDGRPESLGRRFSDCIDQDAIETVRQLDELNAPDPKDR